MKNHYINRQFICFISFLLCISASCENYIHLDDFSDKKSPTRNSHLDIDNRITSAFESLVSSIHDEFYQLIFNDKAFWKAAQQYLTLSSSITPYSQELLHDSEYAYREALKLLCTPNVEHIAVTYSSHDNNHNPITLSGGIYIPKNRPITRLIIANHYTVLSNKEAPSQMYCIESIFALNGAIVIMPDYLGYGITDSIIHPYLNARLCAQHSIDLLLAALPYLQFRESIPPSIDFDIIGYSQGAAVTIAMQQIIESNYKNKLKLGHVYAGAGPYDPAETYDYSIQQDQTFIPCCIPMIIQGMSISENLSLDYKDFFKEILLNNYEDWINSKQYTLQEVNLYIHTTRISDLLTPIGMNKTESPTNKLYQALCKNRVTNYHPKAPLYLFHSTNDNMVPFVNSTILQASLAQYSDIDVTYNFDEYGGHMEAALIFYRTLYNSLR